MHVIFLISRIRAGSVTTVMYLTPGHGQVNSAQFWCVTVGRRAMARLDPTPPIDTPASSMRIPVGQFRYSRPQPICAATIPGPISEETTAAMVSCELPDTMSQASAAASAAGRPSPHVTSCHRRAHRRST